MKVLTVVTEKHADKAAYSPHNVFIQELVPNESMGLTPNGDPYWVSINKESMVSIEKDTPIIHMVIEHIDDLVDNKYPNLYQVYNSIPISKELENILIAEQKAMGSFHSPFPTFGFKYHECWLKYYELENVSDVIWNEIKSLFLISI